MRGCVGAVLDNCQQLASRAALGLGAQGPVVASRLPQMSNMNILRTVKSQSLEPSTSVSPEASDPKAQRLCAARRPRPRPQAFSVDPSQA